MAAGATLAPEFTRPAFGAEAVVLARASARLGPHVKHSPRNPCPVCGNGTSYCITFADGATICGKTPSDNPAGLGYMHWPGGERPTDWRERLVALPKPAPRPVVDADLAHRAYEALLALGPLSDAHRAALRKRGLSDEQIARHGYATGPADAEGRRGLAAAVAAEVGQDLVCLVPGFVRNRHDQIDLVCGNGELLIPVRDEQGRVVAIRRRLDAPGEGGKYRWLSGGDQQKGGISVDGNTVHVAYPPRTASTRRVLIVEGEIKANITADRLGLVVLSVPGVSNTGNVLGALAHLGDAEEVLVGYDEDAATNEHVAQAETRLARLLAGAGYMVMQLTWPAAAGKGVDDILTSTPPTIPLAMPHPALQTEAAPHDAIPELAEVKRLHSLSNAARRSPNLGAERHTLTDFVTMLSAQPEGEWAPMPYAKIGDQAGIDARTAERQLSKAGIRPKEGDAGVLAGLVDVTVREVPERVNEQTGQVTGGYKAVHVRRLAPLPVLLHRIATAPPPEAGKRNNHGGKRTPCPRCGETGIERTITDRCAGCGELVKQHPARIIAENEPDTPGRHLYAHPPADDAHDPEIDAPRIPSYRGDNLPATPPTPITPWQRAREATRGDKDQERRQQAYASLAAWQERSAPFAADDAPPGPTPPLTLFPLPAIGCQGCGAAIAEGQTYCRACD